jgi:hypothetical protein
MHAFALEPRAAYFGTGHVLFSSGHALASLHLIHLHPPRLLRAPRPRPVSRQRQPSVRGVNIKGVLLMTRVIRVRNITQQSASVHDGSVAYSLLT